MGLNKAKNGLTRPNTMEAGRLGVASTRQSARPRTEGQHFQPQLSSEPL